MKPTAVLAGLVAGASLMPSAGAESGSAQVTFRAGVNLVDVEVSVLDRNRLPVAGLTAADFTVREEGQMRPIVAFTPVDLPPRVLPPAPWMTAIAPDTHSNDFPREGRLVVILMDRTIAMADYPEARRIAEGAVHQLREGDMAAVAWSLHGIPQNFTADRERLLDAIREPVVNLPEADTGTGECDCGRCSMEAIAHIAEAVEAVSWRRKLLLFIGHRLPTRGGGRCALVNEPARQRALRAAEAGNLTIHAIDPAGLQTLAPLASVRGLASSARGAELRRVASVLSFTDPTGGRFVTRNQPSEVLPEIFRESASYYVLGFEPAYTGTDGRFRRITVRVNRPDVLLQARRGYYAPGRTPRPGPAFEVDAPVALTNAIAGLWPRPDVRITLGAAPVAVPGVRGGAVAVVVGVRHDAAGRLPTPTNPARPAPVETSLLVGAFDHTGRAVALDRRQVTVQPHEGDGGSFVYEIASRLQVRPGRYEIRAAVEDATLGRTGSAYTYVDVPDFARELVSLSGVFVQAGSPAHPIAGASLRDLTPLTPTTRRRFARTEAVTAFLREYQSAARTFMPGYATVEITDVTDTRVYHQQQRIEPLTEGHHPMDFRVDLPVSRLASGPYVLTFEVRHGNESARRSVRFDIE
jgi:VWFA-related protein